jgi:hypothetical protein
LSSPYRRTSARQAWKKTNGIKRIKRYLFGQPFILKRILRDNSDKCAIYLWTNNIYTGAESAIGLGILVYIIKLLDQV